MKYPGIFVGRNSSRSLETKQWQDMIANPRQSGVVWHRSAGHSENMEIGLYFLF